MNGRVYSLGIPIIFVSALNIFGIIIALVFHQICFDTIDFITVGSVLLFSFIIVLSTANSSLLSFWLAFIILGFPSSFDNILPGVYLESPEMQVIFPITNHIELFLIFILFYNLKSIKSYKTYFLPYVLIVLFILSITTNLLKNYDEFTISLLCTGLYPVRILILLCLLINNIEFKIISFIHGLGFSVLFLFIESLVYTKIIGANELTSASLGCNTFGNVIGQITCLFIAGIYSFKLLSKKNLIFVIVGLLITVFTGTRMALLALITVLTFIIFPTLTTKLKTYAALTILFIIGIVIYNGLDNVLGDKFNMLQTMQYINLSNGSLDIEMSENTSSILTRLSLWDIAIRMFIDNPLTGIGWNLFNIYKYDYGFKYTVIIDPHNGYLALLSQLGLIAIPFIVFYYIYPWILYKRINLSLYKLLLIFNMGMSICELTNAGIYKFKVFTLMSIIILSSYYNFKQSNKVAN